MGKMNRRDFIHLTGAGNLALLTQSCRNSEIKQMAPDSKTTVRSTPRIRYDIDSPERAAKRSLENLNTAIGLMKKRHESDYCSWVAQAKIHKEYCPHRKPTFLPWHRAYLFYFEEICRKLLKEDGVTDYDDFALPYWDWSRSPQMPEIFWKDSLQNDIKPPFGWVKEPFEHQRQNKPDASANSQLVGATYVNEILEKNFYAIIFGAGTGQLESGPHNHIHTQFIMGNMGDFATAALDPIFWVHHANIDRLWLKWMKININATPSPNCQIGCIERNPSRVRDWLLSPVGRFYDVNGNPTNPQVCSLLNTFDSVVFNGGYCYENDLAPTVFGECTIMKRFNSPGYFVKGEVGTDKIAGINESVTVKVSDFTKIPATLSDSLNTFVTKFRQTSADILPALLLTIEVEKPADPQMSVRVFINAFQKSLLTINSPAYVATFTFFESTGEIHQHGDEDMNMNIESRKFTFDVSDTILRLSESQEFSLEKATVSIYLESISGKKYNNYNKEEIRLISFEFDLVS